MARMYKNSFVVGCVAWLAMLGAAACGAGDRDPEPMAEPGACPTCVVAIDCIERCGGPVVQTGCCPCPTGSFDRTSPDRCPEPSAADDGLPAPMEVCVRSADGTLVPGTAVPSRAGVYDPRIPAEPAHLNWMVTGVGCVTYPGPAPALAGCGGAPDERRPEVTPRLCWQ